MFQYFLPGIAHPSHVTPSLLRDRGLGDVLADCLRNDAAFARLKSSTNVQPHGPEGHAGVMLSPLPAGGDLRDYAPRIGFHPDEQQWREVRPPTSDLRPPIFLLWEPARLPTPAELRRETPLLSGYDLELGDGQVWTAPRIRRPSVEAGDPPASEHRLGDGTAFVPSAWGVDAVGNFTRTVRDEYRAAWEMAGEIFEVFVGLRSIERPEALAYCVRVLGLNYRLGPQEATALKLFDDGNYQRVFWAPFDGELLNEFIAEHNEDLAAELADEDGDQKKSDSGECSTPATGSPVSPAVSAPATAPPTENSG
jgi:hypothetical protein